METFSWGLVLAVALGVFAAEIVFYLIRKI